MKKLRRVLLMVCFLVVLFGGFAALAEVVDGPQVYVGTTQLDVPKDTKVKCLFIPEESGRYIFESAGVGNQDGYLFDEYGSWLAHDYGNGGSFRFSYKLIGGTAYYVSVSAWERATVSLTVTKTDADYSGSCGENTTWSYDDNGTLTISGTGNMQDYYGKSSPWYDVKSEIHTVVIENGVLSIGSGAFIHADNLMSVTIPGTVTRIGRCAFQECTMLESVVIPEGVESIEYEAFSYCYYLSSVTLPKSLTSIEDSVFDNASFLKIHCYANSAAEVYALMSGIPMEYIGEENLYVVSGTNSIDVPMGEIVMCLFVPRNTGVYTFESVGGEDTCGFLYDEQKSMIVSDDDGGDGRGFKLTHSMNRGTIYYVGVRYGQSDMSGTVTLCIDGRMGGSCGENVTWSLDNNGTLLISGTGDMSDFNGYDDAPWADYAYDITRVVIQNGVTSIGNGAFVSACNLWSVEIPSSVKRIGDEAFGGCMNLSSVEIPNGVTSIGRYAFNSCYSLTKVNIPASVTSIGSSAFIYCTGIDSITVATDNICYSSIDGILYDKYGSRLLCCPAGRTKDVLIPASVTDIETGAFTGCSSVKNIRVSDGNACYKCVDGLVYNKAGTKVVLCPVSRTEGVAIADGVTTIGDYAFNFCEGIQSVKIPASVTAIGNGAFQNCHSLTELTLPSELTSIGNGAFFGCYGLKSLKIPDGVTTIGDIAFENCENLAEVTLPSGLKSIGKWAFFGCGSLSSLTIPDSVTEIDQDAFIFCDQLTLRCKHGSVADAYAQKNGIPVEYIEGCAHRNFTVSAVPATASKDGSVTRVCNGCGETIDTVSISKNAVMRLPTAVKTVEAEAFSDVSVQQVVIPSGATAIGSKAFSNCAQLKLVVIPDSVMSVSADAFSGCADIVLMCGKASPARNLGLPCADLK